MIMFKSHSAEASVMGHFYFRAKTIPRSVCVSRGTQGFLCEPEQHSGFFCFWRGVETMRMLLALLVVCLMVGCATPPEPYDHSKPDPLLESIEFYRRADCLRNCADRDLWENKNCD